ncbi:hypothetical protein CI102_14872 [Trichoderma harzianum]|uniref:Uncharacterized protein n=1 Tax=Trichoderma harzianum CBS 226.95 TaxID=983964 RepID=A0A2T4A757_TRIHA|nr:hypothetical protein M431DRAFT_473832 [Trichoderma harzianum CBS 226.95]PKK40987.1 hypothetical protein CI102_14872 [Trichoderma harzianum]PTB52887.1 hypothetical protein M431DRAFT_473832 [Trichoderma harzianum CBS 226.95]
MFVIDVSRMCFLARVLGTTMTNDAQEAARKKKAKKLHEPQIPKPTKQGERMNRLSTMSPAAEDKSRSASRAANELGRFAHGVRGIISLMGTLERRGWRMEKPGSGKGGQTKAWKDKVSTSMEQSVGANRHRTGGSPAGVCAYGALMGHCHGGWRGRYS